MLVFHARIFSNSDSSLIQAAVHAYVLFVSLHELNIHSVTQVYKTCPNRPPTALHGAQPTMRERERERRGEEFQRSEKFKENKSGRKEEEEKNVDHRESAFCLLNQSRSA